MASTAAGSGLPAADTTQAAMDPDGRVLQPSRLLASTDVRIGSLPGSLAAASPSADVTIAAQETFPDGFEVGLIAMLVIAEDASTFVCLKSCGCRSRVIVTGTLPLGLCLDKLQQIDGL